MIVRFGVIYGVIKYNEAEANDTRKTDNLSYDEFYRLSLVILARRSMSYEYEPNLDLRQLDCC